MKILPEEICGARPEGQTMGNCGAFTMGIQCANCTMPICFEHAHMCKACRDECRHHLFCGDCKNTHKHSEIEAA